MSPRDLQILDLLDQGLSQRQIARETGLHQTSVGQIIRRLRGRQSLKPKHVTAHYDSDPILWAKQCNDAFVEAVERELLAAKREQAA